MTPEIKFKKMYEDLLVKYTELHIKYSELLDKHYQDEALKISLEDDLNDDPLKYHHSRN
jgi:hypothetical protein